MVAPPKREAGEVTESLIRQMTRLAAQHDAVNLSQGFPNDGPPLEPTLGIAAAALGGALDRLDIFDQKVVDLVPEGTDLNQVTVKDLLAKLYNPKNSVLNQYSIPYGIVPLREAIRDYYLRFYNFSVDAEKEITVTCGATEAFAATMRALCEPDEGVLIIEPYHELYPQQCSIFHLRTEFTNLIEVDGKWEVNWEDFETQAKKCKAIVLNLPHNPTGKVFTHAECERIVNICLENDIWLITDEIYEMMIFNGEKQICIPQVFPQIREKCIVINSVSKTCSATGWRVGWTIANPEITFKIRGIHDQMVLQAPTPIQSAVVQFLKMPQNHFTEDIPAKYKKRRDLIIPALHKLGFKVINPDAAYYAFCNYRDVPKLKDFSPMEASLFLVEKVGVATVPGDNFYARNKETEGIKYIRFCFCRSEDLLEEAIKRLNEWLK